MTPTPNAQASRKATPVLADRAGKLDHDAFGVHAERMGHRRTNCARPAAPILP
jgi:hypothetical protein